MPDHDPFAAMQQQTLQAVPARILQAATAAGEGGAPLLVLSCKMPDGSVLHLSAPLADVRPVLLALAHCLPAPPPLSPIVTPPAFGLVGV